MSQPFAGTTAFVTGAASGIGLALSRQLVGAGALVVLADIDGDAAHRRATELGGSVHGAVLDVTDEAAFTAAVVGASERFGPVDLLINNAGVSIGGPTHEMTAAHWNRLLDVNLRGVVNGILATYPGMVARRSGQIVNVASGAGLVGLPFVTGYSATKHAVVGLTGALRAEASLHGVRVSALCPGAVETPILDASSDADLPVRATPTVSAREYLGAVGQKPIDVDRAPPPRASGARIAGIEEVLEPGAAKGFTCDADRQEDDAHEEHRHILLGGSWRRPFASGLGTRVPDIGQ